MENKNKPNPDDRSDNVEKIRISINDTIHNIELADEMLAHTSDKKMKKALEEKNVRREKAIDSMKKEIKDEEFAQQEGYE